MEISIGILKWPRLPSHEGSGLKLPEIDSFVIGQRLPSHEGSGLKSYLVCARVGTGGSPLA